MWPTTPDRNWPAVLLRGTAITGLLTVLVTAQIAVLYLFLGSGGTHPLMYPQLWFIGVMVGATAVVLWRAHRNHWGDRAATLTAGGLVLLVLGQLTLTGWCETGSGVVAGQPTASLKFEWLWYHFGSASGVRIAYPAISAVETAGRTCESSVNALPIVIGYLALAGGLWLHRWLDDFLDNAVTAVNTRLSTNM